MKKSEIIDLIKEEIENYKPKTMSSLTPGKYKLFVKEKDEYGEVEKREFTIEVTSEDIEKHKDDVIERFFDVMTIYKMEKV